MGLKTQRVSPKGLCFSSLLSTGSEKVKGIPIEALKKLESPMNLICVTPVRIEALFSEFKESGYSSRQTLEYFQNKD